MPFANTPPGAPFGPDWQLRALIARQGYSNKVTADVARLLADFYVSLRDRLASGVDLSLTDRRVKESLARWARERLDEIVPRMHYGTTSMLARAGPIEQAAQRAQAEQLRTVMGLPSRAQTIAIARFESVIESLDVDGVRFGQWWKRDAETALLRMQRTVARDVLLGAGPLQVASRVFRGPDGRTSLADMHLHQVRTAVRTAMTGLSSEAARIEHREMRDVIQRVEIVATIDTRTSKICIALDGKTYRLDDPNLRYSPYHLNCRTTVEPIIDLSALGLGQGTLGKRVTMAEWFARQDPTTQNDMIGKARAGLYRQGKLSLAEMISDTRTVYTAEQLERRMAA